MNDFLASLHDESVDQVMVTDPDVSRFFYTNYSFRKFWGSRLENSNSESPFEALLDRTPVEDRPILESIREHPERVEPRELRLVQPGTDRECWFRVRTRVSTDPEAPERIGWVFQDVTIRQETEHKLLQERERFHRMARAIDEVLILLDGAFSSVLYINQSSAPGVYGRRAEEIPRDPRRAMEEVVHPEDLEEVREWTEQFLAAADTLESQREFRILPPDQTVHWIRQKYFKINDLTGDRGRIVCLVEDVTDRKNLERRLERQERRFRRMAETIDQAFFLLTPDNHFLYVNPAFESIYGVEAERLGEDPMAWTQYVHPEDLASIQPDLEAQRNRTMRRVQVQEIRITTPDRGTRWVRVSVYPVFDDAGDLYRLVGTSTDITEENRRQRELESALEQKQALLQEVHHRVKNNLQVISSLLGLEARRRTDSPMLDVVQNCQNRIQAMALVHRHLYRDEELEGSVELISYLQQLVSSSVETVNLDPDLKLELNVTSSEEDLDVSLDTAVPLGLAVNELITNSLHQGGSRVDRRGSFRSR